MMTQKNDRGGYPGGGEGMDAMTHENGAPVYSLSFYLRQYHGEALCSFLSGEVRRRGPELFPRGPAAVRYNLADVEVDGAHPFREAGSALGGALRLRVAVRLSGRVLVQRAEGGPFLPLRKDRSVFFLWAGLALESGRLSLTGPVCAARRRHGELRVPKDPSGRAALAMDDYLIPDLGPREMEGEARRLLQAGSPRVLRCPGRPCPKRLALALGLRLRFARITEALRFAGRYFPEETAVRLWGAEGQYREERVPAGTVLIDERIREDPDLLLRTVAHECLHALEHREFLRLQKLCLAGQGYLSSPVRLPSAGGRDAPVNRLERQAERLVSVLLMPESPTRSHLRVLLCRQHLKRRSSPWRLTVQAAAETYGLSPEAAEARMQELGFREEDNPSAADYACPATFLPMLMQRWGLPDPFGASARLKRGGMAGRSGTAEGAAPEAALARMPARRRVTTPRIEPDAALRLYLTRPDFRGVIDTGRFLYADGCFCLDRERYIVTGEDGLPHLTEAARREAVQCCILFRKEREAFSFTLSPGGVNSDLLFRGPELYRPLDIPPPRGSRSGERLNWEEKRLRRYLEESECLPYRFGPALKYLIRHRGFTYESVAENALISSKQVQRYCLGEVRQEELRTVIALCVTLQLETDLSDRLLYKCGRMPGNSQEDLVLQYVLHTLYRYSVPYCNAFLESRHYRPLTGGKHPRA